MDKNNFDNEIYSKKIFLLNKLFYIITHQSFNFRNLNDLDNLINRFVDLSDSIGKPKEEMMLKNIKKRI
jgi:hypothetical protein